MKCIILAGGSGDRLWPLSRKNYPKQFLNLGGENSLFQETIIRNMPFCDEFYIVTNADYAMVVEGQMRRFQGIMYHMILEDEAKGTAPALAFMAHLLEEEELLIVPADLYIQGDGYSDAIYQAKEMAKEQIVLFGIRAEEPSTIFGYIRYDGNHVKRFIEKPSASLAGKIFSDDDIFWNSGMLLCRSHVLQEELHRYACGLDQWAKTVKQKLDQKRGGRQDNGDRRREPLRIGREWTKDLSRLHIEKALLEQSDRLAVVPLRSSWVDISNFDTYEKMKGRSGEENVILAACENTSVLNTSSRQLIVANHLKDAIVIGTGDAVYITDREYAQDIKGIIASPAAQEQYREYFDESPMVYRSWGTREIVIQEAGYRVRKLTVYPGETLTRHIHTKRNENYSVVKGMLSVELEEGIRKIGAGESINILPGVVHRLYNETDEDVIAVEVDTGEEINEQDMLRMNVKEQVTEELPSLYRLKPAFKDYIWGGRRLREQFGKDSPYEITAESWELSAHPDGQSHIEGGPYDGWAFGDFVREKGTAVCGWKSGTFDRFPILIKFIDASNPLSVQVHPFDDYAYVNENEFGKNEMWYVMDARPGAFLYCGFSKDISRQELERRIGDGTIEEVLNKVPVQTGDVVFIPAGTVHAIGAGILICEIQQNSNSTYRVYDYNRRDAEGNLRPLHIKKALDVISTAKYEAGSYGLMEPETSGTTVSQRLCLCKYFECTRYCLKDEVTLYLDDASFVSLVFLSGQAKIRCQEEIMDAAAGDSFFVSAGRKVLHVEGACEFIATNI